MLTQTEEQIQEYLTLHDIKDISPRAFNSVLKLYSDDRTQIVLSKDDFLDIFVFMQSPARIRNLLFPNTYTDEEDKDEKHDINPLVHDIKNYILKDVM